MLLRLVLSEEQELELESALVWEEPMSYLSFYHAECRSAGDQMIVLILLPQVLVLGP